MTHRFLTSLLFMLGLLAAQQTFFVDDAQAQDRRGRQSSASDLSEMDFERIRVDDLTDQQIREIMQRAEDRGLDVGDLERMAVARGMRPSEVVKFRARLRRLDPNRDEDEERTAQADSMRTRLDQDPELDPFAVLLGGRRGTGDNRIREIILDDTTLTAVERDSLLRELDQMEVLRAEAEEDEDKPKIFGSDLFSSESLTFAPSLNIPTPPDYQLAAGDELVIDIWGAAEMTYELPVTRDGSIRVENLGPIYVNGLTITEAEERILARMSSLYSGLNSTSPSEQNMYADVSLGAVRTINVHIVGEVEYPGSYSLPSLSTVFNALYVCSGPSDTGSYRNIEVMRGGQVIARMDIYEFLMTGSQEENVRLRDQDIVKVGPYLSRVRLEGNVKREGYFEMRPGETVESLLAFSGGFSQDAYTRRLKMYRETDRELRIVSIAASEFTNTAMQNGDHVFVDQILERFENRVEIEGAVYRPGEYQLEEAETVYGLIDQAEGLKGDALLARGQIFRTRPDQTVELVPFDVGLLMNDPENHDISLVKEDVVVIPSRTKLREAYVVEIHGSVQNAGTYPFVHGMTLQDLIVMAGGLEEAASLQRVEVARRRSEFDPTTEGGRIANISYFNIDSDLSLNSEAANYALQQFDEVFVRRSPNYIEQRNVEVAGEVLYPGVYTIESKDYSISDIIKRAGGLSPEAYPEGGVLVRTLQGTRFAAGSIGIDLTEIMQRPKSDVDLLVEAGDSIHVPLRLETVSVQGAVYYPANIRYRDGADLMNYISQAGGTTDQADLSRTYVIYPNGSVDKINRTLLVKRYPDIEPGAAIIVPTKPDEAGLSTQERTMIWSSIVSVAAVVSTAVVQLTR